MNEHNANKLFVSVMFSLFSLVNAGGDTNVAQCERDRALCRVACTRAMTAEDMCHVTNEALVLLHAGADPNAFVSKVGCIPCAVRPLHLAACEGNQMLVKTLLSFNADSLARDGMGATALSVSHRQTGCHPDPFLPVNYGISKQKLENHYKTRCILSEAMTLARAKEKEEEVGESS